MGRERDCTATIGGKQLKGRALLETDELIFRSTGNKPVKVKLPIRARVEGGELHLGDLVLDLGDDAGKWAHAINHPKGRLEKLGIKKEDRDFSPHLTLARVKNPVPLGPLRQRVQQLQPAPLGKFPVSQFALFRSDPGSNASIYRKLQDYRLEAALAAS